MLKKFLNSEHEEIYNPLFLAQMVLSPLNSIVAETLMPLAFDHYDVTSWEKARHKKSKLHVLCRFHLFRQMLEILGEFGSNPDFEGQRRMKKLINSKEYGKEATSAGAHSAVYVTGFTSAFFLTLPEVFLEWTEQKDGDGLKDPKPKSVQFLGQQCFWPTFNHDNKRQTDASTNVVKGRGTMTANAQKKSYSFLPEILDLKKLFENCLDGTIEWKTASLCQEIKMIQSPAKKEQTNLQKMRNQPVLQKRTLQRKRNKKMLWRKRMNR